MSEESGSLVDAEWMDWFSASEVSSGALGSANAAAHVEAWQWPHVADAAAAQMVDVSAVVVEEEEEEWVQENQVQYSVWTPVVEHLPQLFVQQPQQQQLPIQQIFEHLPQQDQHHHTTFTESAAFLSDLTSQQDQDELESAAQTRSSFQGASSCSKSSEQAEFVSSATGTAHENPTIGEVYNEDGPETFEPVLVEQAKNDAQEFALQQLCEKLGDDAPLRKGKRRSKIAPEQRDERRIQKNRNSAFISRIRKRHYTTCLEKSLEEQQELQGKLVQEASELRLQVAQLREQLMGVSLPESNSSSSSSSQPLEDVSGTDSVSNDAWTSFRMDGGALARKVMGSFALTPEPMEALSSRKTAAAATSGAPPVRVTSLLIFFCLFGLMIPGLHYSQSSSRGLSRRDADVESQVYMGPSFEHPSEYQPPQVWSTVEPDDWEPGNLTCIEAGGGFGSRAVETIAVSSDHKYEQAWLGFTDHPDCKSPARPRDEVKRILMVDSSESQSELV